jgi:hypothetical protein
MLLGVHIDGLLKHLDLIDHQFELIFSFLDEILVSRGGLALVDRLVQGLVVVVHN